MASSDHSELKDGARLVREVLKAIPPAPDDREDAVIRAALKGMAKAVNLAAKAILPAESSAE
jgi:hypothetical protein